MPTATASRQRWLIIAAFALLYIVWGSTYLAIAVAVETIPPFAMSAIRFSLAAVLMLGWAFLRGSERPTWQQWRSAMIAGMLLFLFNNGLLVYAESIGVPSGVVALLIGTTPMWVVILNTLRGGTRPTAGVWVGLALGTIGVGLLVNLNGSLEDGSSEAFGALLVLLSAFFWALGSLYARGSNLPQNPILSTGMQLLWGAIFQIMLALSTGDFARLNPSEVSAASLFSMLYLAIVSSIITFTAFTWLMRTVSPALVSTYAYVNPVIAVILGWLVLSEPITWRTVIAAAVIISAVAVLSRATTQAHSAQRLQTARAEHDAQPAPSRAA
jgi:drug/metabolite transporter (DMT)-like permease